MSFHESIGRRYGTGAAPRTEFGEDDETAIPADVRNWLVKLRLLEGVPFANIISDSALLPPESIRWFYLDRRWTDALVQGALSVGTINSDDRAIVAANYPAIRAEVDQEERNVRRPPGTPRQRGPASPVSGFLLRSKVVSGWPALHVRAFNVEPEEGDDAAFQDLPAGDTRRLRLLRLERLAPAVLLCLFDGTPKVVHVEEPRQGVQFGFDHDDDGGRTTATLRPRDKADFSYLDVDLPVPVPFRVGNSGVVDIRRLEGRLAAHAATGAVDGLGSAEYALQAVRLPFRLVFGATDNDDVTDVFVPTVLYRTVVDRFVSGEST